MTDFEDQLRQRMRAEVSGVRPDDHLAAIRRRTEQTRSTWWVPIGSGLAALGLVVAAVTVGAEFRGGTDAEPAAGASSSTEPSEEPIVDREPTRDKEPPGNKALPSSVYLTSPTDVTTNGPLRVTGESNTFEATVNWRALKGGEVVREGYAMGGSYGEWEPFAFTVDLPPGSYVVEVYEVSAKDGSQQSLNTVHVTVD